MNRRILAVALLIGTAWALSLEAQSIFTIAGGGTDDGRPATLAGLAAPSDVVLDQDGNLFLADPPNQRIRMIARRTGLISTVAGNGTAGFGGDGGPATQATLDLGWFESSSRPVPTGIAVDGAGNLFIADRRNRRVRRVAKDAGIITTVAGCGDGATCVSPQNGISALDAWLDPLSIAIDRHGNLFIGDRYQVWMVAASTGRMTHVAGDYENDLGDGGPATRASIAEVTDIAVDRAGNIFVAQLGDRSEGRPARIRKITAASGIITTVAGGGNGGDLGLATQATIYDPRGIEVADDGTLFISCGSDHRVRRVDPVTGIISTVAGASGTNRFSGDGGPATEARLDTPIDSTIDPNGNLFIADSGNGRVRIVSTLGLISTFAGNGNSYLSGDDGGSAKAAQLPGLGKVALDATGNLYLAESESHRVRRISTETGRITTIAGNGTPGFSGDGGPATAAQLFSPQAVAFDRSGNLLIADDRNNRVRKVDLVAGTISTIAGSDVWWYYGDGGPATRAGFAGVTDLEVDADGNILLADWRDNRIRRVEAGTGIVSTVAGNGGQSLGEDGVQATEAFVVSPSGIHVDDAGMLYIAEAGNNRIRRVDADTGVISTVAGCFGAPCGPPGDSGPATAISLYGVTDVTLDLDGNLVIAETTRVRHVHAETGTITTIAGGGDEGFAGDGGPATRASLSEAVGVAIDAEGGLYIADRSTNGRVRVVFPCVQFGNLRLTSPTNGSSGISSLGSLAWEPLAGAFRYDVYLDTNNPPRIKAASDIETTLFTPSNLAPLTTYYWKIVAKGDPFCEPFGTAESEVWSFMTTSSCEVPEPAVP